MSAPLMEILSGKRKLDADIPISLGSGARERTIARPFSVPQKLSARQLGEPAKAIHVPRIELGPHPWQGRVIPLYYTCFPAGCRKSAIYIHCLLLSYTVKRFSPSKGSSSYLQERRVAVESLLAVAKQLQAAHPALAKQLENKINVPDHHLLDTFMQTVKAAFDVRFHTFS